MKSRQTMYMLARFPLRKSLFTPRRRSAWRPRSFSSSSVGTPDPAAAAAAAVDALPLEKHQPVRPIFPWRHEQKTIVLPRLDPKTEEYEATKPFPTPQAPFAPLFLGVPLWDAVLFGGWKTDLAENMTYAFLQGVTGIMSNVYRIPRDSAFVDEKEDAIKFSFPSSEQSQASVSTDDDDDDDDNNNEGLVDLNDMLAPTLRKLYESAHENGRDQLRILLETRPLRSIFYRLYAVPFFTRDAIEADPGLLKKLFNDGRPEWNTVFEAMQSRSLEQLQLYDFVETTVAAEVYIICEEKFQVVDAETGVVLQGPEGVPVAQEVGHVVTFEMTAKNRVSDSFPYWVQSEPGSWQITDIDDLVSTKKWYHV